MFQLVAIERICSILKTMALLHDAPITLKEAMSPNSSPTLAEVFREVLLFLNERPDGVLFGAHAVNAYVEPARMTSDVDIMSTAGEDFAEQLRLRLADKFHIAMRIRTVAGGSGFRVYQLRPDKNRHLVDVRQVDHLPAVERVEGVQVIAPAELVMMKLVSLVARRNTDKGISDRLDLHRMLMAYPEYRKPRSVVFRLLDDAPKNVRDVWSELLLEQVDPSNDDEY